MPQRVDVPCTSLGFLRPPPGDLHLKFLQSGRGWTVLMLTRATTVGATAKWFEAEYPNATTVVAPGIAPKTIRAQADDLPPRWLRWLKAIRVHHLDISPDGAATLFVEGSSAQLVDLLKAVKAGDARAYARPLAIRSPSLDLSPRQKEIISRAVALGYYQIPHRVGLRELGQRMGLSVSAASQLLRRAEAVIIHAYADEEGGKDWPTPEQQEPQK